MAWLSDLAGRAEDMLNKLDQNAATVLVSTSAPLSEVKCVPEPEVPTPSKDPLPATTSSPKLDKFVVSAIEQELAANINTSQGMSVEQELAATRIILSEVKSERNELKIEISRLLDQMHVRSNGKQRLVDVEKELLELQEINRELTESNRELNDTVYRHGKSISELQISAAHLKQSLVEAQAQLVFAKDEAERAVAELNNYRTRAQSSLQLKERIIEELRAQDSHSPMKTSSEGTADALTELEIEQLKAERQDHLEERKSQQLVIEGYQGHISKLEDRLTMAGEESAQRLTKATEDLTRVDKERNELRQEVTILTAEIQAVRTQSTKSNGRLVQQLFEKDQEIAGLRKRSSTYQSGGSLDNRIKSLTQSLIQKQTTLEEVTSERNALRIQLEHHHQMIQQQKRQDTGQSTSAQVTVQHMTDDDKAQLPLFIQENPFDNRLAKRMKRVIRASDSAGAVLGGFLRRYPLLRILFLVYTVLLHVWVMVVLMSSTPTQ